jgi:hypothetical protein
MDIEMEAPVDNLEALFVEEDEDLLAHGRGASSGDPLAC